MLIKTYSTRLSVRYVPCSAELPPVLAQKPRVVSLLEERQSSHSQAALVAGPRTAAALIGAFYGFDLAPRVPKGVVTAEDTPSWGRCLCRPELPRTWLEDLGNL